MSRANVPRGTERFHQGSRSPYGCVGRADVQKANSNLTPGLWLQFPYVVVGMLTFILLVLMAFVVFHVPIKGSFGAPALEKARLTKGHADLAAANGKPSRRVSLL